MPDSFLKVWILGNATGAVTAMEEAAVALERTGRVMQRTGKQAEGSFVGMRKASHGLLGTMGLSAGLLGIGGVVLATKKAISASMQWQSSQAQLRNALANTGDRSAKTIRQISAAAEASSTRGGFDAATQVRGVTQFVTELGSANKALQENAAVTDLARSRHTDYATALSMVEKAQIGQTKGLKTVLGPSFQLVTKHVDALRAKTKQANAAKINQLIVEKLRNSTQAYSKTTEGAVSDARNAWDLLARNMGDALLPTFTAVVKVLGQAAGWLAQHKTFARDLLYGIGGAVAAAATVKGVSKLFGGGRSSSGVLGQVIARGATPANPLFVWNVGGGKGGIVQTLEKDAAKVGGAVTATSTRATLATAGGLALAARGWAAMAKPGVYRSPLNQVNAFAHGLDPTSLFTSPLNKVLGTHIPALASLLPSVRRVGFDPDANPNATANYLLNGHLRPTQAQINAIPLHPQLMARGQAPGEIVHVSHVHLNVDGRPLAEVVHRHQLKMAAR